MGTATGRDEHRGARTPWLLPIATLGLLVGCGATDDGAAATTPRISSNVLVTVAPTTTTTIPTTYTIQEGDTLSGIAERFHLDVAQLAQLNGITDPDDIEAGQTLNLPAPTRATTTTGPP